MTLIIAEAGVNHNGDVGLAFELVDAASKAGADIVNFQTFKSSQLASKSASQARYQTINTGIGESQLSMLKGLELPKGAFIDVSNYCKDLNIEFLTTAFDSESLEFITSELTLKRLKIPSGEITNAPFLLEHARSGMNLIVSTGMATLGDIENALGVIAFGYLADNDAIPSYEGFREAYSSLEGQSILRKKVTLLHCTTEYPAPFNEINLRAMDTLSVAFGLNTGYSDHSEGLVVSFAAVARGAKVIEKHFTLDQSMEGPDHKASIIPEDLNELVRGVRAVELSIGVGLKSPTGSEVGNMTVARKSIMASSEIKKGDEFTYSNLSCKRPGNGRSPYEFWKLLGKKSQHNYKIDELIR